MHPVLFSWGFITVYAYGAMVALAFLAGISVGAILLKRYGLYADKVWDLAIWIIVAALLGGRLFYVIEFRAYFLKNPQEIIMVWHGGLVFYGGLILGVAAAILFIKLNRFPFWPFLDVITPPTVLGYALGRIGCFLNGCCYGVETTLPWAVHFPEISGLRHPTQLYASFLAGAAFLVLLICLHYKKFDGQVFGLGLLYYSVYRFLIEFLRINPRHLFNLSEAQLISLVGMVGAGVLLVILSRKATGRAA
jgi:phosphatidylglycerol:prolipoprotein diacylglycerol transferase